MRNAKIVCTLGPASSSREVLKELISAGMDCARLNFSHGTHENHRATAKLVRELATSAGRPVSLLADLQGPKVRVGSFSAGPVMLERGSTYILSVTPGDCNSERAAVSYPGLVSDAVVGGTILLDDGLLRLVVLEKRGDDLVCEVEEGGQLSNHKGVNLPGVELRIPALTAKDRLDLKFAVEELEVDYLALSFVQRPEDVLEAQSLARGTPVIAKLEKPQALVNLEAIVEVAEGIMVARGDLGVEVGPEKVPLLQKRMIRAANARGKLVITATQMLESMIRNSRPTRAEAADVANAVLDGTDAVMLSGETAMGAHPEACVRMMSSIVTEVERDRKRQDQALLAAPTASTTVLEEWEFENAAAHMAAVLSSTLPLCGVVVLTRDGRTAELLSEYRPEAPIFALTVSERAAGRLALHWGVQPRLLREPVALSDAVQTAADLLAGEGFSQESPFALVTGWPTDKHTNTVTLQRVR